MAAAAAASDEAKTADAPVVKLKMKRLGTSGCMVSELCLGTMTFGDAADTNNWGLGTARFEESCAMLDRFREAGGNFIDTADAYGAGESERVIGRYMEAKGTREEWVIATKGRFTAGAKGANNQGNSRKHLMEAIDSSLKRLKTDYVDLYQLHAYDTDTPLEETFRTLNDLVRAGKVRYIGLSNFHAWHIASAMEVCRSMGLERAVTLQPQYNLMCRQTEWDLVPVCQKEGMGLLPWSPLKGGFLTGRYRRNKEVEAGSRLHWAGKVGWKETSMAYLDKEQNWNIVDKICEIGEARGRTPAQVSLRWLMQKPGVTAPIIGAKRMAHLEDNLQASTFELTDEEMAALDKVSEPEAHYPYGMWWSKGRDRS